MSAKEKPMPTLEEVVKMHQSAILSLEDQLRAYVKSNNETITKMKAVLRIE
jgi:exonuclease VII small subunit